jgi:acylphosphatase
MGEKSFQRRQVLVEGYVQGVGYRAFVRSWAIRLNVSGWVRNRTDGAVEALVQGGTDDLEALLAEMRRGPLGSEVISLRIIEADEGGVEGMDIFIVRPTL